MARELGVEPAGALGERGEVIVSGGEADAGADRREVVEVTPHALELEQDRAHARELGAGSETECVLAGKGVRDAVRDCAGGAGARRVGEPVLERLPFRRALETAVLVEEPRVEVQDALADDVEPEVTGLDDPGVDRPDGDLVGIAAADRHRPAVELEVVVDERPQRLVPREGDAMEIVRLALVPAGGRDEVDDRRNTPSLHDDGLEPSGPRRVGEQRADAGAVRGRVEAREAPALRECRRDPLAVGRVVLTRSP